ncbi:MAG: ABC-F family ATP-binding cassette domain-containing protein [Syntrophomonadaceae bacterium]|nr:ABC-F family ATP-binding cassette domain-containing protein [Syntrophomonadaceae bacterium]
MSILSIENVVKSYGERILLDNISFSIDDNDKIGVIGINGTGKSTLFNLIAGNDAPESGMIKIFGDVTIEYLPQNPQFDPEVTILEQVLKGDAPAMQVIREYEKTLDELSGNPDDTVLQDRLLQATAAINSIDAWYLESQIKTVLTKLGIRNFAAKMGTLSGGQKKRVALARALITPCDLLLLDEPTNHMDTETVDWLENYLEKRKGALLMITHDRYFLDKVVNKIIELDDGKAYLYHGNYAQFVEQKSERASIQSSMEAKRQSLYKKELEWIRTGARARSTKQKARIQRFEEIKAAKIVIDDAKLDMPVGHSRLGRKIIEINNISKSFGTNLLIKDFSYLLLRDDRIGIIGANGVGKSTLLNILAGKLSVESGTVDIGTTVKIAYLSQESEDMDPELRAIEYIKNTAEYVTTADGTRISAAQMMERFLFPPDMQWIYISRLSGGEKRRLYLLKVLMDAPNVLFLDEPTNNLDIDTLNVLENYIEEFDGAVIAVSHDRYFLDRTCHRIFSFAGDGKIVEHIGNYTDFTEYKKTTLNEIDPGKNSKTDAIKKSTRVKLPKFKFTYKEQLEYETIDEDIKDLEDKISQIDDKMSKIPSDFVKLQELMNRKEQLEEDLLYKMERQEYLSNLEKAIKDQI